MAQLTLEVDDQLMAEMAALALAEQREAAELVAEAIAQYVRSNGSVRLPRSVKAKGPGVSVSVAPGQRPSVSLVERKRLGEHTRGIWKDKDVEGMQYQLAQRLEW